MAVCHISSCVSKCFKLKTCDAFETLCLNVSDCGDVGVHDGAMHDPILPSLAS